MDQFGNNYYWLLKRLYTYDKEYKKFADLTTAKIEELTIIINNFKQRIDNRINNKENIFPTYLKTLNYLLESSYIKGNLTFDEKIFILIEIIDPEFNIFKEYLTASPYKSNDDKKTTERLIRKKFGFFEPYLIKYESDLYRKLKAPTEFLSHIKIDLTNELLKPIILIRTFDDLTDEEVSSIKDKAFVFAAEAEDNSKETLSFNAIYSNKTIKERIAFFITILDPDLNVLRIYEEESKIDKAQERIIEEFDFYHNELLNNELLNSELLRLEKIYHKRFCPDKKVSIWSI